MTLWVKLPIRLKHAETYVIKQKTIIGQALSSYFMAELHPLHTAFFAPYSCRQCLRFPWHSTSSEFPIHSLKHDWVEGLYSCLEFFSNVIYLALIKCMSLFLNKLQVWMLCLVVPTWYLLLSIFEFPKKMRKYKKIYIYKKIFGRNQKNNKSEKRMLECQPKFVEEIQKCKRLKFDSESPVDKENSIWRRKVQNQMFMDSIKSYLTFNWIYGGFDCKKNWFLSQFRLLLDEIKVLSSNYNFEELI